MAGGPDVGVGDLVFIDCRYVVKPAAVGIECIIGKGLDARHIDIGIAVEVPEFGARRIRVVRVGEGYRQAKGAAFVIARVIENLAHGEEGHFVVIFKLVGDLGDARLLDGGHIVVPPINPSLGLRPVRGPAEIGGVNIGGQTLLQPVKLIRPDKMHLSRKTGAIALEAKIMRKCRDGGGKFRSIVIDAVSGGQKTAHERGARRSAQRAWRIEILEDHALRRQCVDMRRFHYLVPVGWQELSGELIGNDEKDVWPAVRHICSAR